MTSKINYTSIDSDYPRSGRDNSAQGFRNNFSATKNALTVAYQEITNLQTPAVKTIIDENNDTAYDIFIEDSQYQRLNLTANTNITASVQEGSSNSFYQTRVEINNYTVSPWTISFTGASYAVFDAGSFFDAPVPTYPVNPPQRTVAPNQTVVVDLWATALNDRVFLKVIGVL